ncbi:mitogen-activated protein kinase kinase kinase 3-like isoform X2 [Punica granatum]|uniref:Mitogen-activated protein kinase kinase kinase 3-like isoform X2 n=2 Tax=Punica granatum TaxID=22663 RepID=A0A6P8CPT1_PUNGR|nr:mitogen-activated protein kinase kinase kinase 3-like isoform X2 [Punica granatum]PKI79410.1 hypothetical protein CRG98_000157 [Punica granatum]
MPAWWSRKSIKSREETLPSPKTPHQQQQQQQQHHHHRHHYSKPKSFDDTLARNSPRSARDSGGGGFAGFDSDGVERKGHPLPRPSGPVENGSVSVSVSSVSSSGSSDDHQPVNGPALFGASRGLADMKSGDRPRSPGPCSRGPTSPTSPLHPRLSGLNVDSPSGSQCHPLPLPPGSPTSPSALPTVRTAGVAESSNGSILRCKKGRLLGRGTFGHVYLGFSEGKMCAIKEVRVSSDDQTLKESLKQLNQEINLLNQLSHVNIVRYYGSEMGEEALSVYLEYVSGGSIHKLLQEYGPFEEPVIRNYTRQITCGLAYLHGRNVVHRDIKGANILVHPNGEVKLSDFGMAKHITSCSSMLSFKGSPYWMAPEVVMNINGYSLAVDIWSLGCTILEMATSKPPWSQYEGVAAIFKIGNSKDMPEIPDHLSNEAKSFIRLCLQREPSARPTASKLLDHPFIRDQATIGASNNNITRDSFPSKFDGSRTPPPALELHSYRPSATLEMDYTSKPVHMASRALRSPRETARMITSLPVSPCSSPLRQHGTAQRSCYLSPPHPIYSPTRQTGFTLNDYSVFSLRPNTNMVYNSPDVLHEASLFRSQTPGGSPRTRII